MKNSGSITKVSLLLGTIICLGAFFLVDNNIPVQALHKEEQILDDYDDLAEFANAVKNGDEEDLEEIPIQSMEAADIYDDADDSLKDCIDLAAKVGDSLSDREVIHCVDDVNYFKTKYSSNSSVPTNGTFATTTTTDTDTDTSTDATSTSEASTADDATSTSEASTADDATSTSEASTADDATSTSEASTADDATSTSEASTADDATSTSEASTADDATSTYEASTADNATSTSEASTADDATSTSEASTADDATSTSEASTADDATPTENNLINELVNTGKFTEDEAKEFVSKNMLSGNDAATTSGD